MTRAGRRLACLGCRHYEWGWLDDDRCAAFPDGIPREIWLGDADHAQPFPGDGGTRFEPRPPTAELVKERHAAWSARVVVDGVERIAHEDDPLGAIVLSAEKGTLAPKVVDHAALEMAWRSTKDVGAALLVLLRARRTPGLARAVQLTREELELEGCDFLDDQSWLSIGLSFAAYETVSALANVSGAWVALAPPYGGDYTTARTERTFLRNLLRAIPTPPPLEEWIDPASGVGIGPLANVPPASRLPAAKVMRMEDVALVPPWSRVGNARDLEEELSREVVPGHPLYARQALRAFAKRSDSDDVLFVGDGLVAVVQLTWAKETSPSLPRVEFHPSLDAWVARRMRPDQRQRAGTDARVFAYAFRSPHSFEAMVMEKLPDRTRWDWIVRDSSWYGEYIWGKSGATRVRIFTKDDPCAFVAQVDLVGEDDGGEGWLAMNQAVTKVEILRALDATDIEETTPEFE